MIRRPERFIILAAAVIALAFAIGAWQGCAHKSNRYETYIDSVNAFTEAVEKYEIWYQAAPEGVQAIWREKIDPQIEYGYTVIQVWGDWIESGEDFDQDFAAEIDMIITKILIEVAKRREGGAS